MKKAKEKWIENKCSFSEDNLAQNNSKEAYKINKELTCEKKGETISIHDTNGNIYKDIMNIWNK